MILHPQFVMPGQAASAVGSDPYFSDVTLLLKATASGFQDYSNYNATLTTTGSPVIAADNESLTGYAFQPSDGNYIDVTSYSELLLDGAFTIDVWLKLSSYVSISRVINVGIYNQVGNICIELNDEAILFHLRQRIDTDGTGYASILNEYFFLRITRDSSDLCTIVVDGDAKISGTLGTDYNLTTPMRIGAYSNGLLASDANISEIRITKGVVRDHSEVPTQEFPVS